ncbi:MAG: PKD domain-containing protein, partial [Thermoplasmata archaeon]|nr:PKD domain-containing protein [Thermoplasmata archaeon]
LGSSNDRFIPDESRIIPICEENLQVNLFACLAADMPESMIFQNDPEESSESSSIWGYSGTGGNWTIIDEGIIGDHCWHIETEGMENTHAELKLNFSLTSSKGNRYLTLWNKYDISAGAELKICLIDESGNYELVEKIGSGAGAGQRGFRGQQDQQSQQGPQDQQDSGWGMSVYNLTPFLEETEGKNISFILKSDGGGTGDYWNIDAVRITSEYPEASGNITLSGKPRAHIDDISPNPTPDTETVSFKGHGTDDGRIERYLWHSSIDGPLYNGTNDSFSKNNLSNGTHTIYLKVQDNNGVWSEEVSTTLAINGKPRATIESITPNPVLEGKEVTFTGSGTDDGTIERYLWLAGSDVLSNGTETSFSLSDLSAGTHTIKLKVQDNNGAWSEVVSVGLEVKPDADGDGASDENDAFPDDPAASKDSDEDGYPDEWNEGKTKKDSTTDLKRDKYPDDPKKWEEEDDDGGFIPGMTAQLVLMILAIVAIASARQRM